MKNVIHTIASFSFVTWVIGYFTYDVPNAFHFLLLLAIVTASLRIWAFKPEQVRKTRHSDINSGSVDNHDVMG